MARVVEVIVLTSSDDSSYGSLPNPPWTPTDSSDSVSEELISSVNPPNVIDLTSSRSDRAASALEKANRVKGHKTRSFVISMKRSFVQDDCRLVN